MCGNGNVFCLESTRIIFFMNMEMRSQYGENLHRIRNGIQIADAYAGTLRITISYHNRNIDWTPHVAIYIQSWAKYGFCILEFHKHSFWGITDFSYRLAKCAYSIWNSAAYITHKTEYLLTDRRWEKSVFSCFVIGKNMRCKQSF